jgi:hypothetical protein
MPSKIELDCYFSKTNLTGCYVDKKFLKLFGSTLFKALLLKVKPVAV